MVLTHVLRLRRLLPMTFVSLFLAAVPAAARSDVEVGPRSPGAWAAEFGIDPAISYDIGYTGSATLAVRRHSSARTAWRLGAMIGFSEDRGDGETFRLSYRSGYIDSLAAFDNLREHRESHEYSLFLHMVRFLPERERLAIFWELGPSFRFGETRYYEERVFYDARATYDASGTRRTVALDADLGFEWLFSRRLSLGARFGAFVAYSWGERSVQSSYAVSNGSYLDEQVLRVDVDEVDVRTTRALVTLSAYF